MSKEEQDDDLNMDPIIRLLMLREAYYSTQLDKDPDMGTHSIDDDCEGGHNAQGRDS